jgi:flagellar assembly factor FliW
MIIESDLLGSLEIDPSQVFHFPSGLYGFPDSHHFVLLPAEQNGLYWLQSTEHSTLVFVLVDPFAHFDEYAVDLGPAEMKALGDPTRSDLLVLAIVTLPRTREEPPTANLQGPIALNLGSRVAGQFPLSDTEYELRAPFALPR